uniref:Uncharacterized protein n=1 Tax=viral metagenome TaxID=1070528 RepID=A0A6M3XM42_9ZZZZ
MGLLDRIRRIRVEYVSTVGGKKIPASEIGEYILKVYINGKWLVPDPAEVEGARSRDPISMDEIEDIDRFDGVKCSIHGKNMQYIGDLWKYPERIDTRGKKGDLFGDMGRIADSFNEFANVQDKMRGATMRMFPEIEEMKKVLSHKGAEPKSFFDELKEKKEEFELLNKFFGGVNADRSKYPFWASLIVDKTFREGVREMAVDFVREAGKAVGEGYKEGFEAVAKVEDKRVREPLMTLGLPKVKERKIIEVKDEDDKDKKKGGKENGK